MDTCIAVTIFSGPTGEESRDTIFERCYIAPEGALITAKLYDQGYTDFVDAMNSSSEDIGGFFPDNPLLSTNFENGYGYFTIVEVDTTWITF